MRLLLGLILCGAITASANADTIIGAYAGGTAEAGWLRWDGGALNPLGTTIDASTDYASDGDGGSLKIDVPGNTQTLAYDAFAAGTVADFIANNKLVFDVAYAGIATDQQEGGFNEVWEVAFNSQNGGFSGIGGPVAGTFVGFAPGDQPLVEVLSVEIDYSGEKADWDTVDGTPGGWLQLIFAIQDSNRPIKYIDNVRLTGAVPEPSSAVCLIAGIALVASRRRVARCH